MENQVIAAIPFIINALLFLALLFCSIEDIRSRQINVKKLFVLFFILIPVLFIRKDLSILEGALGMLLGIFFLGISKITRGQIGAGDGMMLVVLGLGVGIFEALLILYYALFLVAGYAAYLFIRYWNRKKPVVAFLPFLFAGFILEVWNKAVVS